ncbi:DNA repair and recombination protein RadB [Candidatus Woesearchaeota archaeon]|nr:DNA repair and recombination protein RadB [Candidatus Woesearchaeota archaeon]
MEEKIDSGSPVLNRLLEGGFEKDVITTIFGPAGAGKSTACLMASVYAASLGKKVIYIDTEGGFSATRLGQLAGDADRVIKSILFLRPTDFAGQRKCIGQLRHVVNHKIGLIIVDTITNLYRCERTDDNSALNRDLGKQVSYLLEISRTRSIPVILTNQVYSDFNGGGVRMVGGDIIMYSSKCLIELKSLKSNKRLAILQKHRHIPSREILFEITSSGFSELKDKFRIF